jgi:hypothetical protein
MVIFFHNFIDWLPIMRYNYVMEASHITKGEGECRKYWRIRIYYVKDVIVFDTQIIVTKELASETHSSLRILSRNVKEEDARRFLGESESFDTQGDNENAEAILQVSVSANRELYKKLKEEFDMCQALQELMKDEIDEKINVSVGKAVSNNTERLNKLNAILLKAKRYDDLERSTEDKDFQDKLLDELVPKEPNS